MDEQRNFLLTVLLCMSIYLGWQWYTGQLEPPPPAAAQAQNLARGQEAVGGPAAPVPTSAKSAAALPSPAANPAPLSPPASAQAPVLRPFATPQLVGQVRDGDGALTQLSLPAFAPRVLEDNPTEAAQGVALMPERLGAPAGLGQAALTFRLASGDVALHFAEGNPMRLVGQSGDGTRVEVSLRPDPDHYAIDYAVDVVHQGANRQVMHPGVSLGLAPLDALEAPEAKQGFLAKYFGGGGRGSERLRALVQTEQKLSRINFGGTAKAQGLSAERAAWAALDEQYFLLAWVPQADAKGHASLYTVGDTLGLNVAYEAVELAPGERWRTNFRLFAGPKRDVELAAVDPRLQDSIDYTLLGVPLGFLARPMVALLRTLHGLTHSWGAAILLLTLVVKMLLLPVVYKSMASMRRMQELKPELDQLKARYADDKERQQQEQLKLFRERGVNPVSGCLPMLLQIPVWITLYRMLWGAVDLYRQPFLWLHDLTAREPFPYLALAVGAATFLQQKVTPVAVDNQQARTMLVVMPAMVTVFMINLPSGLTLYMLANSVLTIAQQLVMHRRAATPTKA